MTKFILVSPSDETELNLVKNHASSARFVKEVYNFIILNKDTR